MGRSFWKATGISIALYTSAVALAFLVDFRLALFLLLALQVTWTLFCLFRAVQLRLGGAQRSNAEAYDRESFGFALGGSVSSLVLLVVMVILTQAV